MGGSPLAKAETFLRIIEQSDDLRATIAGALYEPVDRFLWK